ncbi:hypothetical protein HQN89_20230 [Paenibacillus frigoriresistens]|uniref:hypothetical protein n=1 Tax=Paenibacillus alginolyticus TaxID=59839 RepID=UPI001565372E|nr:hypothetical protein [Paenibacillus frigoriresistens]NRF93302.1 hypothetical protein [Paenibacillus frigoriresistens]
MTKPEEQEFRPPVGGHGGGPGHGGPGHGGPGHHGFPEHGGFHHFGHGGVNNLLPIVVAPYLYATQPYYPYPYPTCPCPYPYQDYQCQCPYPYQTYPYPPYSPGYPGI